MSDDDKPFSTDVENCARCGGDHDIVARPFQRPPAYHSHWAWCPVTDEPLFVAFEETSTST